MSSHSSTAAHSSTAPRRIPQQKRGQRRVAGFLRAAAAVINDVGYERATMSAIAGRANSCIGSLYQFFPNKRALAEAVRALYVEEIEQSWTALGRQAADLTAEQLAGRMVSLQLETVKSHPALLALLDVPPTPRTSKRRELIRARIAAVLMAHRPAMQRAEALRIAAVAQHVNRALLALYAKSGPEEKAAMTQELRLVLTCYLVPKLKHPSAGSPPAAQAIPAAGKKRRTD